MLYRKNHWAAYFLFLCFLLSAFGAAFYFYTIEQKKKEVLSERILQAETFKLLGKEESIWKAFLQCRLSVKANTTCIPLGLFWGKKKIPANYSYVKKEAKPACFVCHSQQKGKKVIWAYPKKQVEFSFAEKFTLFFLFLFSFLALVGSFVLYRKGLQRKKELIHILVFVTGEASSFWKYFGKRRKLKKYLNQVSNHYLYLICPEKKAMKIVETLLTQRPDFDKAQSAMRNMILLKEETLSTLWPDLGSISARMPKESVLLQEEIYLPVPAGWIKKPAVWKKSNHKYAFQLWKTFSER
ncbi:MAG: hypothetical protein D6767_03270 [Candidatus Hydrogenedentota bacterium]|nr:MAG: hypothetical protein D6767_03270 [Candidatus Hydrogenedentota bacterium]